eukprot:gene11878-14529_t
MSRTFQFVLNSIKVDLSLKPYVLTLRNPFGTAHSLTTTRQNALITISIDQNKLVGYGESGLPPKKPNCYLADYNDIESYFETFTKDIQNNIDNNNTIEKSNYDPFNQLSLEYFKDLRNLNSSNQESSSEINQLFSFLFYNLDHCSANDKDYSSASMSAIEMALLDCWGQFLNQPIYKMANLEQSLKPFYYTISLLPSIDEMLRSADFGSKYTRYFKIKLDSDMDKGIFIISNVLQYLKNQNRYPLKISVDANSSWNPKIAMDYLQYLKQYKELISMVEQPFPIEITKFGKKDDPEYIDWINVKKEYEKEGLLIFADESVANQKDLDNLIDLVHGVNVKLEKAGGIRPALKTILKAKELGLKIWVGCMVASKLNVSAAAHLLVCLSEEGGDLDGELLVDDDSQFFENGFSISKDDGLIDITNNGKSLNGIGITSKRQE